MTNQAELLSVLSTTIFKSVVFTFTLVHTYPGPGDDAFGEKFPRSVLVQKLQVKEETSSEGGTSSNKCLQPHFQSEQDGQILTIVFRLDSGFNCCLSITAG